MHDRERYYHGDSSEQQKMLTDGASNESLLSEDLVDDEGEDDDEFDENEVETEREDELEETMSKWTNYIHGWQDRWVVLKNGTLSYFKSRHEMQSGCRGSMSLARAVIEVHEFDHLRFDVSINDSVWYLRVKSRDSRQRWIECLESQKAMAEAESTSLQRHGSMVSLHSGASLTSSSSFKKGRGLTEKLAEMETFRDILCRQIDTMQSFFDTCAEAVPKKWLEEAYGDYSGDDDENDIVTPRANHHHHHHTHTENGPTNPKDKGDKASFVPQYMGVDFRGEAVTFKATTQGVLTTLSHCIDLMKQREEQWQKRLEKEQDRRKRAVEAYKQVLAERKHQARIGGPDYEEGPHSIMKEEEFFDAIEAALDIHDEQDSERNTVRDNPDTLYARTICADKPPAEHKLSQQCNEKVEENIKYAFSNIESTWDLIHQEGEMKVYKSEQEIDGVVCDPLKATHTIRNVTSNEMCFTFWDVNVRMEWDTTLDISNTLEVLSPDTVISHQLMKRVWPATQRDTCFVSHLRKLDLSIQNTQDVGSWLVINFSTEHPKATSKCIRAKVNVSMLCQTFLDPPDIPKEKATRENLVCKIYYVAHANPGGWVPGSVLRTVYKREYPKFLRKFSAYVQEKCKDKPISW
ncbi:ceramide transfer protein-like [Lytechinus variegatus]|uniref:ceramide transfer protein-like n=2 Tax=Lytechinus variegatus TaxID=7654 RepID=UPI001BB14DB5|nr:ceramide transfer protein-like [Lytechinus variegatus]